MTSLGVCTIFIPGPVGCHRTRGQPGGSHHIIGSFHCLVSCTTPFPSSLPLYPVFTVFNFACPSGVIGGRSRLNVFSIFGGLPSLEAFQNPERSCGSKGRSEWPIGLAACAPAA